ncbi:MAG: hypothetical protein ACF8Q5_10475 [Phycisphaerales bacterium JB040]
MRTKRLDDVHDDLLRAFLDARRGLVDVSASFGLTLGELEAWLGSERTRGELAALERLAEARGRAIAAQGRALALATLVEQLNQAPEASVASPEDLDRARRASGELLRGAARVGGRVRAGGGGRGGGESDRPAGSQSVREGLSEWFGGGLRMSAS